MTPVQFGGNAPKHLCVTKPGFCGHDPAGSRNRSYVKKQYREASEPQAAAPAEQPKEASDNDLQ
jgi:hypothetical protein